MAAVRHMAMDGQCDSRLNELMLPELDLGLSPTGGKANWADEVELEVCRVLAVCVEGDVEEGEILGVPRIGSKNPFANSSYNSEGISAPVVYGGEVGMDPMMNQLVDSVLKEEHLKQLRKPWIELFAHNRKPSVDHRLSKVEIEVPRIPNGNLDLSKGFELGLLDEAPHCLIGFPLGRRPSSAAHQIDTNFGRGLNDPRLIL
ncbi:hypothetical protein Dimus_033864 [Dionaea muscipula]